MRTAFRVRSGPLASTAVLAAAILVGGLSAPAASAAGADGSWDFEETAGTVAADSSAQANHGTIRGAALGEQGYQGYAFGFSALNPWVEVPSAASLNPGTSDFTASAWVNFTDPPGSGETYDVIRKGLTGTAGGEYKLEFIRHGRAKCLAKDADRLRGVAKAPWRNRLGDGTWHQVGCRLTGNTWQVVVDGVVKGSSTVAFGSIGNTKSLSIGSKYGLEDGFPGRIDSVRLDIG